MKRTDWIIAGFLAVLILAVGGGFVVLVSISSSGQFSDCWSANNIVEQGSAVLKVLRLKTLLLANQAAAQWQPDAQLVWLTAHCEL